MKTNKLFYISLLLLLAVFLLGCPKPIDPIAVNCVSNYENVNGECQCPDDYFEIGNEQTENSCIKKTETRYYMNSNNCFCDNDFIIDFDFTDTSSIRSIGIYSSYGDLVFLDALNYTEKEDGDEIRVNGTADMKCSDGILYTIEMTGKFNPERTEMIAEVNFLRLENNIFIESGICTFLLSK